MRRFVALDRDGTLIEERPYLSDPAQVRLLPNAAAGLRTLRAAGFELALVTNQPAWAAASSG
jgi:D-glycero-D-manno-heptose 1,7-bisphosphate phosphatase